MILELRWYFRGPLPHEVLRWFQAPALGSLLQGPKTRTDTYLIGPGCGTVGVKHREGKIQTKVRLDEREFQDTSGRVKGIAQVWDKWSWELPDGDGTFGGHDGIDPQGPWVDVTKDRRRHWYILEEDGSLTSTANDDDKADLGVELTTIKVLDQQWWTIAFDAFGGEGRNEEVLSKGLDWIFANYPLDPPMREDSTSYPGWLLKVDEQRSK